MKNGSNKRTMFLLGALVLCVAVWFFTRPSDTVDSVLVETAPVADSAIVILQKAQSIQFDFSVLNSQAFMSLVNRNLPLLNLPVGRDNPFAPAP